ncbi:MAG: hypothetical protein LC800_07340 [Acidobacteria bacterium]|nr:hypothetical protein [Acidobacteriota bacterium]
MLPEYSSAEQRAKTFNAETRRTQRGRSEDPASLRALRVSASSALMIPCRARAVLLVGSLVLACVPVAGAQQTGARQPAAVESQSSAEAPLTNASVVKLVRAKFSEKIVITIIRTRPARFDLAPDRLIELKKSGVSERVILAMLARDEANVLAGAPEGDDFDGDPFFGGPDGERRGGGQAGGEPGETNIFGSSGGARGRTRTNGVGGGAEGETQTTGSASVKIIRPPAEAGGAPPKLERTPTLTNESVAELVAAGFSEGTIIRRIEGSPAEFDLSPAKLAELRRRRVTDPIINAMRAAMSDDGVEKP